MTGLVGVICFGRSDPTCSQLKKLGKMPLNFGNVPDTMNVEAKSVHRR